ncbi:phosphopantetheine-binding protein [Arenibacter palladensis]|uniref:thioesterase domain-containing protein n=1 Tax=Arenibacter palladensis TaxID=237373 RepID=UPI002FD70895
MPEYMIPVKFIQIEEIPKLPNGKVNLDEIRSCAKVDDYTETYLTKPKNSLEEQLVSIWEEVLNFSPISTMDNFFEIGGDSILSIQIIVKCREQGISIAPNQLFKHQTIADLSDSLMQEITTGDKYAHLVEIKSTGTKPPLYCLHAGGIHLFSYNKLAQHIESQRPIYALQASPIDTGLKFHNSVEEMAIDFLLEIKRNQPKGPYHIMAYCFSTAVGLEIAKMMKEQNETVNFMVVDTIADYYHLFALSMTKIRILRLLKVLRNNPIKTLLNLTKKRIKKHFNPKLVIYRGKQAENKVESLRVNYLKIYKKYQWKRYAGHISLLLSPKLGGLLNTDIINSWKKVTNTAISIYHVEGKHDALFSEPKVQNTSAVLDTCMQQFEKANE